MSDTKKNIVSIADRLIRTVGYNGFSYKDISQPLKIKNAAVHYHFPKKANLGVAVIAETIAQFSEKVSRWEVLSAEEQLHSFIGIYEENNTLDLMCFMGAMAPSFQTLPPEMQEELSSATVYLRSWLGHVLNKGMEEGTFKISGGVQEKADQIVTSLLAALLLNRLSPDDVLENVRQCILLDLGIVHEKN